jgi:hypothetical protein
MTDAPNDAFDPGDLLRRLRPHGGDEYLAPGDDPRADALLHMIVSREIDAGRSARHARRVVVLVAAITVVGASAAAAVIMSRSAGNPTELSCYSSADVKTAMQVAILPDTQRTPIEQCAELWTDGRIARDGAPHLVACVTDADIVAVIPGDDSSCIAAGWVVMASSPSSPSEPITDRTSELTQALSERFAGQCLDRATAVETVEDLLHELQLSAWTVADNTTDPDACAVPIPQVKTRSVELISLP